MLSFNTLFLGNLPEQISQNNVSKIELQKKEPTSPFNQKFCISGEKNQNTNSIKQQTMTPFSKFINGLSPISKISKEAAQEISNFKNIQGSIYANQQKVNYYLSTPSPQSKCKTKHYEENNLIPPVQQTIAQKLDFNNYQQTKNHITVIKIQSPVINLNYERLPAPELENELNLQSLEQGILDQQALQNNTNSGLNFKSSLDLANFMYEFKFVEGGLEHAKRIQKSSSNEAKECDEELSESSQDSEFLNQLQVKEHVECAHNEEFTKRKEETNCLINQLNQTNSLTKKIMKFEQFETPKQTRGRKPLKQNLLEQDQYNNNCENQKSALKSLQKTTQLSEQLQISLASLINSNKVEVPQPQLSTEKKKVGCNCKKSKCLKLYCDCFANGQVCTKECNCFDCANIQNNEEERYNVMLQLIERNPCAFKPKVDKVDAESKQEHHLRGCNCNKSGCVKKYCECYQAGVKCTPLCKCENCKNKEDIGLNYSEDSVEKRNAKEFQIKKIESQTSQKNQQSQMNQVKRNHQIIEKSSEIEQIKKKVKQSQQEEIYSSERRTIKRTRRSYYQ